MVFANVDHASVSSLAAWENFYVIVGSSAAALTGLQFVVMALVTTYMAAPLLRRSLAYANPAKSLMFEAEKTEELSIAN